ncbi:hypothetical protein ACIQZG_09150 [Lysinibacillus sp. NPDC096418]
MDMFFLHRKYKRPKRIVFLDEIPLAPSSKVKKFELREKYKNEHLKIGGI